MKMCRSRWIFSPLGSPWRCDRAAGVQYRGHAASSRRDRHQGTLGADFLNCRAPSEDDRSPAAAGQSRRLIRRRQRRLGDRALRSAHRCSCITPGIKLHHVGPRPGLDNEYVLGLKADLRPETRRPKRRNGHSPFSAETTNPTTCPRTASFSCRVRKLQLRVCDVTKHDLPTALTPAGRKFPDAEVRILPPQPASPSL